MCARSRFDALTAGSADDSKAYVFPKAAAQAEKHTGTISTKFYDDILAPAGLVMKLTFDKKGAARDAEVNLRKASYRGLMGPGPRQNSTTKLCVSNYSRYLLHKHFL